MQKVPCRPSIGSDVECFLTDTGGSVIPCVGIVPGTKEAPHQINGARDGFAIQEDNVMLEFNIPPATTPKAFLSNMQTIKTYVEGYIPAGHGILFKEAHKFTRVQLKSPQASVFGCDPDFDAYLGGKERINHADPTNTLRSCGGHIHLGGDFHCPDFVAALFADLIIGVYLGVQAPTNSQRALYYGKPGIFRPKPYGIEYRSPNNLWADNQNLTNYIGEYGLRLARWLTTNDASRIQKVFGAITWPRVREYLINPSKKDEDGARNVIIQEATTAGVPL